MTRNSPVSEAELRARALSRWEGEGGALVPSEDATALDESELRILTRLGAALLGAWPDLPTELQRRIFQRATTLGSVRDQAQLKADIARFLHDHRDH